MLFARILVTGANGLLGQALVAQLAKDAAFDVLATSRDPSPAFSGVSCGYVGLDIANGERVRQTFVDFAPTVVVNCAAATNVDWCETNRNKCWDINAAAVGVLARNCRTYGATMVQISTDFVFDGRNGPYAEGDRPHPINYYGKSKLGGEIAAREAGIEKWTVVRTNVVYGTGANLRSGNFALWALDRVSAGKSVDVFTDQVRTPTYVEDLADGIVRIIRYRKTGIYHVSGRDMVSMHSFAKSIARAFNLDENLIRPVVTSAKHQIAKRPLQTGLLILKAESEVGYQPAPINEALALLHHRLYPGAKTP